MAESTAIRPVKQRLTPEECSLVAILQDQSGVDAAEFAWTDQTRADGCYRLYPFQVAWWRCRDKRQLDQCFPTGTLVFTEHGHRPIEQVEVGTRVLTHLGRWKRVTQVFDRGVHDTVTVRGHGHFGLQTTADHEFLMEGGFKAPAKGDRWASPSVVQPLDMPPLPPNYRSGRQNIPKVHDSTTETAFLWLYGLWLAEGSVSSSFGAGGRINRVTWSVNDGEVARVCASLELLGVHYSTWDSPKGAVTNVIVCSRPWAAWLDANSGHGARRKHLAGWVFAHPKRDAVMRGMLFGDGYYRGCRWSLSTSSKALCFDFKILAQTLGHSASVMRSVTTNSVIDGRIIRPTGYRYNVEIQPLAGQTNAHVRSEPLHFRSLVKRITEGPTTQCWDLEVEDDHSYVAEGVVVHNCGRCVDGSTEILLSDGSVRPVAELAGQEVEVLAVTEDRQLEYRHAVEVYASGRREVHRVRTRRGREILCSLDHPFLTITGWVAARHLRRGRHVAVAGRLPSPGDSERPKAAWDIVESVEAVGMAETFDIDMSGYPAFVANGFVVHNSVGKTERIMARALAFPFNFPGQEMALVAPEGIHVDSIAERIEARINATRLYREMKMPGRSGVTHRPFKVVWANGARLLSRLPQKSGIGVKSLHPVILECDEGQDLSTSTWRELPEVIRWDIPGARWLIHGVSKGVQDTFYDLSQADSGFRVHRFTGMHRPTWTPEEKEQKIREYGGSEDHPDYRRNVTGAHGNAMNRIVVLERLYRCVDDEPTSHYNDVEYRKYLVTPEIVQEQVKAARGDRAGNIGIEEATDDQAQAVRELLDFPDVHRTHELLWAGMDVGLVADPSEILIAAEYQPSKAELERDARHEIAIPEDGMSRLKIIARISLQRLPSPLQEEAVMHIIDFYKPRAFSLDAAGNGLPLFQGLQKRAGKSRLTVLDYTDERASDRPVDARAVASLTAIKGYNFSAKVVVEFDEKKAALFPQASPDELVEKAGIKRYVKDRATDELRHLVDNYRLKLPLDRDIINSINAQTWAHSQEPIDAWGNRRYTYSTVGQLHLLDAARFLAIGRYMHPIEEIVTKAPPPRKPVLARFGL